MARAEDRETAVSWRRLSPTDVPRPIVATVPYLELKLEHPDLAATGRREQFFPDAVPYELDGERRVFYWRPSLREPAVAPTAWRLACATTHGLAGIADLPAAVPPLSSEADGARQVVVGGTVAGDATTVGCFAYDPPDIQVAAASSEFVELLVDGRRIEINAGARRSIELDPRSIELADDGEAVETQPVLSVRFPGERTIYHPDPVGQYRLFPSFGLDLGAIDSPCSVPTTVGELDHEALAAGLGVDLSERPYPERVLWQAFAHTAFDPHATGEAGIARIEKGLLVVEPGADGQADSTAESSSS